MIVNIGRQLAAGGREIGKQLAERLSLRYYDRELLYAAAKETGLNPKLFEKADERTEHPFSDGFIGLRFPLWSSPLLYGTAVDNTTLFQLQCQVIQNLAEEGNCLFLGRCADYILRDRTDCINIFLYANEEDRIARFLSTNPEYKAEQVPDILEKADHRRANYYNFYTSQSWGEASTYHLAINTSLLGTEDTVDLLFNYCQRRSQLWEQTRIDQ